MRDEQDCLGGLCAPGARAEKGNPANSADPEILSEGVADGTVRITKKPGVSAEPGDRDTASRQGGAFAANGDRLFCSPPLIQASCEAVALASGLVPLRLRALPSRASWLRVRCPTGWWCTSGLSFRRRRLVISRQSRAVIALFASARKALALRPRPCYPVFVAAHRARRCQQARPDGQEEGLRRDNCH